jgi:hypothetical protein
MSCYLTAFGGRFTQDAIPGFFWNQENGHSNTSPLDVLRRDDPWLCPIAQGRRVFTLEEPADPISVGLVGGEAGQFPLDSGKRHQIQLLETLLLRALQQSGERIDLHSRFVALGSRALPGNRMAIDGVEMHLRYREEALEIWMHPLRRIVDSRPLPEAVADRRNRPSTLWFVLEGVSHEGVFPKITDVGIQLQLGRHMQLLPPGAPIFVLLGEEQPDIETRQLIEGARRWLSSEVVKEAGFVFSPHPLSMEELGFEKTRIVAPEAWALSPDGHRIELGEHYHQAMGGMLSQREGAEPALFQLIDVPDAELARELCEFLNDKAAAWQAGFRFVTEPTEGAIALSVSNHGRTPVHIDPSSPLMTQPHSARAMGQIGAIFLECTRLAGGSPWALTGVDVRPSLGLTHALLHGRQNHLSAVFLDATAAAVGGTVMPLRLSELQHVEFARGLRRRLPTLPAGTVVMLAEDVNLSGGFAAELGEGLHFVRVLRHSLPWALGASSYDWLQSGEAVCDASRIYACLPHPGGGLRMLGVEVLYGSITPQEALATVLALEHAWAPGRVEPRQSPGPLEWARGLLFQKSRFEAFLA